ncbi:MAG: hypothetical protein LBC41_07735 [Clostridiales bacterium]|jgi:hypothetical protein|nr:hypothetical protein [Clostridiales bacterium]
MVPKRILFAFIGALFAMAAALGMALVWIPASESYASYEATGAQTPKVSIFMKSVGEDSSNPWVSLGSLFDSSGSAVPGASSAIEYAIVNPSQASIVLDVRQKGMLFEDPANPSFRAISEAQMLLLRLGGEFGIEAKDPIKFVKGVSDSLPVTLACALTLEAGAALCPSKTSDLRFYLPPGVRILASFKFSPVEGSQIDPSLLSSVIALDQPGIKDSLPLKLGAAVREAGMVRHVEH